MGVLRIALALAACCLLLLWAACGRDGGTTSTLSTGSPDQASLAELQQVLDAELARLGIDPGKATAATPTGEDSRVFDLEAEITLGNGQDVPDVVALSWTGQLPGDYDQNGEVNAGDLAPLALNYGAAVEYRDDPPDPEVAWWPEGDVTDTGDAEPGDPPASGSGAHNWRLARIDGDRNGEINAGDVTTIAQHWNEYTNGYRVYRKAIGETGFSLVSAEDEGQAAEGLIIADGKGMPERYQFIDTLDAPGVYSYRVVRFNRHLELEGEPSSASTVVAPSGSVAELSADPAGGQAPLTVKLTVKNALGPEIASVLWDLTGDGSFDVSSNSANTYTNVYRVPGECHPIAVITDVNGRQSYAATSISLSPPTVSPFSVSPEGGEPPLEITFNAEGCMDPLMDIVQYDWDLDGDGDFESTSAQNPVLKHTYTDAGYYDVGLKMTNIDGLSFEISSQFLVNSLPTVSWYADAPFNNAGWVDLYYHCTDADKHKLTLYFDFEPDGEVDWTTSSNYYDLIGNARHYYMDIGEYHPTLTAVDAFGAEVTVTTDVICTVLPTPILTADKPFGQVPHTVVFSAADSFDENGWITGYEFDFEGDGVYDTPVLTSPETEHTYETAGTFYANVRVTDNEGFSAELDIDHPRVINTTSWDVITLADSIYSAGHDLLNVGNRLAICFSVDATETTQLGLYFQISDDGSFEQWNSEAIRVGPAECRSPLLRLQAGVPCIYYQKDKNLYIVRAEDPDGTSWHDPQQITFGDRSYSNFDVKVIDSTPFLVYSTTGLDLCLLEGQDESGTNWGDPREIYWIDNADYLHLSTAGGTLSVFARTNYQVIWIRPDDPTYESWSGYCQSGYTNDDYLPDHQSVSKLNDLPFAAVRRFNFEDRSNDLRVISINPDWDGTHTAHIVPFDLSRFFDMTIRSMAIIDGKPSMLLKAAEGTPSRWYWTSTWLVSATDSSLSSWETELLIGSTYSAEMGEFSGTPLILTGVSNVSGATSDWKLILLAKP